jgi:hypothetical protein
MYIVHLPEPISIFVVEDDRSDADIYKSYHFDGEIWVVALHHWGPSRPIEEAEYFIEQAWQWFTSVYFGL